MKRKYTDEQFIEAVLTSTSVRQVLGKLGLKPAGGNYRSFYNLVEELAVDLSHFEGQGWASDCKFGPKRPLESYLSNDFSIQSYKLKNRLLKEQIFQRICFSCGLSEWQGQPMPLELDHMDGNHSNNNLSNLRLLCPNCHALTDTYRGKNIKSLEA